MTSMSSPPSPGTPDARAVLRRGPDGVVLAIRVQPRSSREALAGIQDGRVKVVTTAPPVEGQANKQVTAWLAKAFGLPKSAVVVLQGEGSREKLILLRGMDLPQAAATLERLLSDRG